ncbi:hypothetical protein [Micromonospora sp. NPDC005652]|uniref:hypothetical protein n=1 Tax=Micromonospora sp. NPDC005652 TaxID=3157046 RepID=UPI0034040F25
MARMINEHRRPGGAFCQWSRTEVSERYPEAGCIGPSLITHKPCPDSRVLCPASEAQPGDSVEVDSLPEAVRRVQRMVTSERYVPVVRRSDPESPDVVVLHLRGGSYGVHPDLPLALGPRSES